MAHLDSAAILDDFDRSSITLTQYNASTRDAMGRMAASSTATARTPVVHTTPQEDIMRMPEADRPREAITIYDTIRYNTPGRRPSEVTYQGRRYIVLSVADYETHGGIFIHVAGLVDT